MNIAEKIVKYLWFTILGFVLGILFVGILQSNTEYYARGAVVTEINQERDLAVVKDCEGLVWEFYGIEDLCVGDGCVMVLQTNKTEEIFDDEIVSVHYERFDILNDLTGIYE